MHYVPYVLNQNEIGLSDIFLVMLRRKVLVGTIMAIWLTATFTLAISLPAKFRHFASLEIGSRVLWGEGNPTTILIDQPENVVTKVKQNIAPLIVQAYLKKNADYSGSPEINASAPPQSQIVVLESKGTTEESEHLLNILKLVAEHVITSHEKITASIRKRYETNLDNAKLGLEQDRLRLKLLRDRDSQGGRRTRRNPLSFCQSSRGRKPLSSRPSNKFVTL